MSKLKQWVDNRGDINELIFVWYLFSYLIFLPLSIMIDVKIYRLFYYSNLMLLFILSIYKNKKIVGKPDFILLAGTAVFFVVDFCFRKNSYTIKTYFNFFKITFIPCYFFSRVTNIRNLMKYLSCGAKIALIFYFFDPFFRYHFLLNYMQYGINVALPAFGLIYINHFIQRKKTDWLFLLLGFFAILVYSGRTCILSVLCLLVLTYRFILKDVSKIKRNFGKNGVSTIKKSGVIILLLIASFAINFGVNLLSIQNSETDLEDVSMMNHYSYSLKKYEQMLSGQYHTILSGRQEIYAKAIETIKDTFLHSKFHLIFGNGTGYFRDLNEGVYTHCILFDLIIEYGILGLVAFGIIVLYCFIQWIGNAKKEKYLLGAYFLCFSAPKLLLSSYLQVEFYLWLFLIFVMTNLKKWRENHARKNVVR